METKREFLEKCIRVFGVKAQIIVAIEEMSELTKELCKFLRGNVNPLQIAEEIADVELMLSQLTYMFELTREVNSQKEIKLERLRKRLEEYEKSKM